MYARRSSISAMPVSDGFGEHGSKAAAGTAQFASRPATSRNALWLALLGARTVGAVAVDGKDLGHGVARRCWSTIMNNRLRGAGVARRLLNEAVSYRAPALISR